jgi:hypothetical protein
MEQEAFAILQGVDSLCLDDFSVVGDYMRYNEKPRHLLKDYYVRLARGIKNKAETRENYLLWGPPSVGKTFLIEQIAHVLRQSAEVIFRKINLAGMTQDEFTRNLKEVANEAKVNSVLCLVDEVDSRTGEQWPFETLVPSLDLNISSKAPLVWALVGSSEENLEGFLKKIRHCHKGADLLSRIPNDNILAVPQLGIGDRLLSCLSEIDRCAKAQSKKIRLIEKFALFYLLTSNQLDSLRQLREWIWRAVSRVDKEDNRLKYDHLFELGDKKSKEFWTRNYQKRVNLIDSYLRFSRKGKV